MIVWLAHTAISHADCPLTNRACTVPGLDILVYRRPGFNQFNVACELRLFSELQLADYAGVANIRSTRKSKFAIYLEKPETQLFYYTQLKPGLR